MCFFWYPCFTCIKFSMNFYHLRPRHTVLLCAIYALSFSTLFYTFIAESYINSSCILLMSYYYARRKNSAAVVLLGVLAAGVTITNAFLWAIIVFATSTQSLKKRLALLILGGVCFCLAWRCLRQAASFSGTLAVCFGSAENYSDHFPLLTMLRYAFFIFFGSTFFFVDTQNATPLRLSRRRAFVSAFRPTADRGRHGALVRRADCRRHQKGAAIHFCWLPGRAHFQPSTARCAAVRPERRFLYSLHHLSAQLLIAALLLRRKNSPQEHGTRSHRLPYPYFCCAKSY